MRNKKTYIKSTPFLPPFPMPSFTPHSSTPHKQRKGEYDQYITLPLCCSFPFALFSCSSVGSPTGCSPSGKKSAPVRVLHRPQFLFKVSIYSGIDPPQAVVNTCSSAMEMIPFPSHIGATNSLIKEVEKVVWCCGQMQLTLLTVECQHSTPPNLLPVENKMF